MILKIIAIITLYLAIPLVSGFVKYLEGCDGIKDFFGVEFFAPLFLEILVTLLFVLPIYILVK